MANDKNQPLISVIVPTCERSVLLPRALDSIYGQTWKNLEVIVVDDNLPGRKEFSLCKNCGKNRRRRGKKFSVAAVPRRICGIFG